ncbi:MAG: acyl carrier protein [Candidatus Omnitrophica bacterium]|nr:acyl carrier protein [Candidatus Omnitrophota bacterium]MCK5082361.1 acyl carrier protein [Candidatus Omnitrophota bacterium]MCK5179524.1 acyl carrier protein [Candidatus Omnitrophota bacterium]
MNERVANTIAEVMSVPADQINEDSSPDTIENWDSLQHMNLILALEEEFDVKFTDDEIASMVSAKVIAETVEAKDKT